MAKRGRPRSAVKTELIHFRLPETVAKELRGSPLGLSGEIRSRLQRSVAEDAVPKRTRDLSEFAIWFAEELRRQTGTDWTITTKSREALMAGLREWIETVYPLRAVSAVSDLFPDLFGPDDPATLGRTIARSHPRAREILRRRHRKALTSALKKKGDR